METIEGFIKDGALYWSATEKELCFDIVTTKEGETQPSVMTVKLSTIAALTPGNVKQANRNADPLKETRKRLNRLMKSGVSPDMVKALLEEAENK